MSRAYDTRQIHNRPKLKKRKILRSRKSFRRVIEQGVTVRSGSLLCTYCLIEGEGIRIAFTVPRRRFGRAVDRNRIKRLMRDAYRFSNIDLLPLLTEHRKMMEILFIYRGNPAQPAARLRRKDIEKDIARCLRAICDRFGEKRHK